MVSTPALPEMLKRVPRADEERCKRAPRALGMEEEQRKR